MGFFAKSTDRRDSSVAVLEMRIGAVSVEAFLGPTTSKPARRTEKLQGNGRTN